MRWALPRRVLALALALAGLAGPLALAGEGPSAGGAASLVDMAGRQVVLPRQARRVACLDVLCYQKLFMLGASGQIAIMYFTDAPWMAVTNPAVQDIPMIHGEPSLEDLLLRRVDLAFFAYDTRRMIKKLASIGIPGLVSQPQGLRPLGIASFVEETKRAVLVYGQALGGPALRRARQWCAYFDDRVRYVTSRTAPLPASQRPRAFYLRGPTALHTQGRSGDTFWYGEMAGANMVVKNDILAVKGPVSMENIIAWDPEVVLVGRRYPVSMVLDDARWRNISAVRSRRVYPLPSGVFYWDGGLEGVLLMQYLAKKLHPALFADLDLPKEVQTYYARFYGYALSDQQVTRLLDGLGPDGTRHRLYNN